MRSLLNFFIRYSNVLIFLILEGVAFYLLFNGTGYHNIRLANAAGSIEGALGKNFTRAAEYFSLRQINQDLVGENMELRNILAQVYRSGELDLIGVSDTIHNQQYHYTAARVVNQTVNRQKNFITLNRGIKQGIKTGMAVLGPDGIVGVVVGTSSNYSVVMSALNLDFRLSARLKANGYYGSLGWDGWGRQEVSLYEIPHHVTVAVGDTVETSGFSAVFPEGVVVGTVSEVDRNTGDFLLIKVLLSTDFSRLNNVYIVGNLLKEEKIDSEKRFYNMSETEND